MAITATETPSSTAPFGSAARLSCRECGETYDLGPRFACEFCFGPLQVAYDFPAVTREQIEAGPASMWRYAPLLPVPADVASKPNLNPGFTKLIHAGNLARELGLRSLYVKDDSGNPTHSFKDRVVAVALEAARNFGYTTLSCSSTGNLAGAVTAAAARAGLRACVFIPAGLEQGKVVMAAVYGGDVVALEGTYDEVNRFCTELIGDATAATDWGFVNVNLRTFYGEGSKTLAYEIAEQLGWRLPEQIVIPIASGAQLTKIDKGFQELVRLGLVEDRPYKIFGAQATGCAPVATAWKAGHDVVKPVKPDTIAKSLAIGNPADGPYVLDICKRTGGAVQDVSDLEIVDAIKLLARTEGVFAETAGGVTVGVLRKLLAEGVLDPEAETVVLNTGDGLKTLDAVGAGPTATIRPSLDEFRKAGLA